MYLPEGFHTLAVGAPVLQAKGAELLQQVQPLEGADVDVALLLDLLEHPRLDQGTSACRLAHSGYSFCIQELLPRVCLLGILLCKEYRNLDARR